MNFLPRPVMGLTLILLSVSMMAGCNRQSPMSDDVQGSSGSSGSSGNSGTGSGSSELSVTQESSGASGSPVTNTATVTATAATDMLVTGKVKSAFLADSDLKSMTISVDTNDAEVTLAGALANQAQIDRAVQVASAVSGVRSVRNRLTIRR